MQKELKKVSISNIPITVCKFTDIEPLMNSAIKSEIAPQKFATPNLNHLRLAEENNQFMEILQKFEHCFADGWPILYLIKK